MAKDKTVKIVKQGGGPMGGVYFVTIIGAAVYFIQNSVGFWGFILAILKALVWPAFVTYEVLGILSL